MFKSKEASSVPDWTIYAEERADVHGFLCSLTPAQWMEPSLCEGWRVHDVAVHLLVDEPLEQLGVPLAFVKAALMRFSVRRINDWWIARNYDRPSASVTEAFAGPWEPGRISRMLGPDTGVRAMVIHHQDMRRALGLPRSIPKDRVTTALNVILTTRGSVNLGSHQRAEGLSLRATDIDWSWGEGPEVAGPAEALMMAVAGRACALADVSGDGLATLTQRVRRVAPKD